MDLQLGKLEQVDLRDTWEREDSHFTAWLAQSENLEQLGEALRIELELEQQEKSVGPFRADIVCKNTADDSWVLIENQIERTDHKHLGQLLTYAAGLSAVTIVWIASRFTDEHRAALDWLNDITGENYRFFGIQIELWRIDQSPVAPRFNIVCEPNDWSKTARKIVEAAGNPEATRAEALRIRYWSAFKNFLQESNSKLRPQKPSAAHWYSFGIGTSQAHTSALLITREKKIEVELNINGARSKEIYLYLYERKAAIEGQIGSELDWREMPDKKASRIKMSHNADAYNEQDWSEQFQWLRTTLEAFDRTFRELLQNEIGGEP